MQMNQLRPAHEFATNYGVKALVFGPPGSGKTPVLATAPRPVLCAIEPGLLSMKGSTVPTWEAPTWAKIKEFFDWFFGSAETKNFDTLGVDSASEMCRIFLMEHKSKIKDGRDLYGKLAEAVGDILHKLYYTRNKHMYIICKQYVEQTNAGAGQKRPYFPGNELDKNVPHMYDEILQLDMQSVPGYGNVRAFHCHSAFDAVCRDRSGNLAEYEPPNLTQLFAKAMA